MDILKYHNDHDIGSNLHNQIVDTICDFEIFFVGVSNGYCEDITLKDVLVFDAKENWKKKLTFVLIKMFRYRKHPHTA